MTGTTAAQQETAITVELNGERVTHGGEMVVQEDVMTNITVDSNATIDLVEVRVNGEIQYTFRPENQSFSQAVPLHLGLNENTVEVIADANSVSTFTTTITKRTAAPQVKYSSPFSTTIKGGPANETTVSGGQVTLAGTLHTISDVDRITLERTHTYNDSEGNNQTSRELYRITDPGTSFSQDLLLGTGKNEIVARYVDTAGNVNRDSFRLTVDDATDPKITLDVPTVSYTDSATVRVTVSDESKLDRVALNRTSTNASQILLESSDPKPDADRLTLTDETDIRLYNNRDTTNEFQLVAEDTAGNTKTKTFTVEYDSDPQVAITENTTNATTGNVRIAGNVSKVDITRVTLETIDTQSGERVDISRVYEASTAIELVKFDQILEASPGQTIVNLIVTYDDSKQYTKTIRPRVKKPVNKSPTENDAGDTNTTTEDVETDVRENNTASDAMETNSKIETSDEPTKDGNGSARAGMPIPFGVGFREAFGGSIIVGSVYLLDHWI